MWPKTELIDLLKITHPIIQAPMVGASTPELVAAVSNAGGLGSYGGAATAPAKLRSIIRQIRELTDKPFGVNLFAPAVEAYQLTPELLTKWHNELDAGPVPEPIPILGPFVDQFTVLLEEKVPVFSFHFGPAPIEAIREIHAIGSIVLATATTVGEANALIEAGVDVIIAQGFEAGGHRGTFAVPYEHGLIGTAALVPQIADAVSVPVIAAGGIMDARGIVAAFALGASGVQMGTAFLACPENNIPEVYRQAVLKCKDEDTVITEVFSGKPARAIRNRFIREMENNRDKVLPFSAQMSIGRVLYQTSAQQSNPDFVSMWAGQGAALAEALPAGELIEKMIQEFLAITASLQLK
ncbi:nitronate monooxygenase [Nostoc flagelliforme FACHB-838]|uniref:Propionate 3-nitronate monooxygenase n=1 Tax=Nostoc flagelliforme FACHB-838 TaxID=2692904 RepID=A0ABR8DUM1_9NOSO|nr:nitronate monooxygenase family protein [Nostoc flagelliforme]MBD2532063.1 nitronate monooxygenase [Nostoc flagelliforme FACHB-838]